MRTVNVETLTTNIKEMCIQANHYLAPDMAQAMKNAYEKEAYERRKYAFVSDYLRLYILFSRGGYIWTQM